MCKVGFILGKLYYAENSFERAYQHFTKLAYKLQQQTNEPGFRDVSLKFLIKCTENAALKMILSTNWIEAAKIMKRAEGFYQQWNSSIEVKILQTKTILKRALLQKKSSSYLESVATLE
jgi:hypothetical protein